MSTTTDAAPEDLFAQGLELLGEIRALRAELVALRIERPPAPPLLTVREAAALSGWTETTIRYLIREGTLEAFSNGRNSLRIQRSALAALFSKRTTTKGPAK